MQARPPLLPVIASIDVAVSMMEGESGYSLCRSQLKKRLPSVKPWSASSASSGEQEGGDATVLRCASSQPGSAGQRFWGSDTVLKGTHVSPAEPQHRLLVAALR